MPVFDRIIRVVLDLVPFLEGLNVDAAQRQVVPLCGLGHERSVLPTLDDVVDGAYGNGGGEQGRG